MPKLTCSECGARLPEPDAECAVCKTLPRPSTEDAVATMNESDAATLEEPPPSDARPASAPVLSAAEDSSVTRRESDGLEATKAVPPPSDEAPGSGSSKPVLRSGRSSLLQSGAGGAEGAGELFDGGKYEILKEIARGGMGAVYKARQRDLNRVVALKVMLAGAMASEHEKKRFLREAEASARLKHPNIVPVYDIGEVDGNLYFTMDFVEGAPLSEKKGELDRARLLEVMLKVTDAVAYAHMRGIIHRDLKPANIMMDRRGEPLIMDFGLAKEMSAETDSGAADLRTREGSIMGTPHYMPPEQAEGAVSEIDVRSDVYALGVIVFELWTGRLPFVAKRVSDLMRMVVEQEPPSPRAIDSSIPWEIEAIALKAMEKAKARRYESAAEMKRDLERFKSGEAILARQASVVYRARKWVTRHRVSLAGTLALVGASCFLAELARREASRRWRESLADARAKITDAQRAVEGAAPAVATIPSALDAARRIASAARRVSELEQIAGSTRSTTETLATRRAALLGLPNDVRRELDAEVGPPVRAADELLVRLDRATADIAKLREAQGLLERSERGLAAKRLSDARSDCLAAVALGAQPGDLLDRIQAEEQRAAKAVHEERAKKALDEASGVLEGLAKVKDADRTLEGAQDALSKLGVGLGEGETSARQDLEKETAAARELYVQALMAKRYFALARTSLKQLPAEARKRLARELEQAENLADAAARSVQKAQAALDVDQPERALSILRAEVTHPEVLSQEDTKRYELLELTALRRAGKARVDALEAEAKASETAADPTLADEKWKLAEREVDALEKALVERHEATQDAIAPLRAEVRRGHGRFQLAAAKRVKTADPAAAERLVKLALANLPESSSELLDAKSLALDLARLRERPEGMERIPDAPLELGGLDETNPAHAAAIKTFYLGSHEVTNAEFARFVAKGGYAQAALWDAAAERARFVDATGKPGPAAWADGRPRDGTADEPVTGVSWFEADAYARWLAHEEGRPYRLPTDDEWEAAARLASAEPGTAALRAYPWGDSWGAAGERGGAAHPEDRSACGCYDMAGNVSEWVARGSVRGGSYLLPLPEAWAPAHRAAPRKTLRAENVGFRVALDAAKGEK